MNRLRRPNRRVDWPAVWLQPTRLEIPAGEVDLEALRSITCEWLVPQLVEKFLLTRVVVPKSSPKTVL